jgi:hypothetical protein
MPSLFASILTIIAAIIPFVGAIAKLQFKEPTQALDSPLLKVLSIRRNPPDEQDLGKAKKLYKKLVTMLFFIIPGYYTIVYFVLYYFMGIVSTNVGNIVIGAQLCRIFEHLHQVAWLCHYLESHPFEKITNPMLFLLSTVLLIITVVTLYLFLINSKPYKIAFVKYNSFIDYCFFGEKIDIIIEAEYHYLFNKCHEALRKMGFQVLEVVVDMGNCSLKAFQLPHFYVVRELIYSLKEAGDIFNLRTVKNSCTRTFYRSFYLPMFIILLFVILIPFLYILTVFPLILAVSLFMVIFLLILMVRVVPPVITMARTLKIRVDRLESSENSFSVSLTMCGENMNTVEKSEIANRFINELISSTSVQK